MRKTLYNNPTHSTLEDIQNRSLSVNSKPEYIRDKTRDKRGNDMNRALGHFVHIQAKLGQENLPRMVRRVR